MKAANFLAGVVGKAHARELDHIAPWRSRSDLRNNKTDHCSEMAACT